MRKFMPEKEIESLLVLETRHIPYPDDITRPMTAMKSLWVSLDCITTLSSFTLENLVGFATITMREQGYDFQDALTAVISFTHK
ncbi:MAG: hypothetical protein AAF412_00610, partial [Pseudomonadota bacterium]